eukprot:Em0001g3526a
MSQNRVVVENKSVLPVLVPSLRTRQTKKRNGSLNASGIKQSQKETDAERERYHADPEKKWSSAKREGYQAEPEKKQTAERERYQADPEKKQTAERERYKADPEKKWSAKGNVIGRVLNVLACMIGEESAVRVRGRLSVVPTRPSKKYYRQSYSKHMEHVITRDEVMEIERILEGSGDGEMAKIMAVLDPVQHHEDEEIEDEMGEIEDEDIEISANDFKGSLSELKPTGCWLGNPAATDAKQRVWTTRTTPDKLASAEFTAKNAPKLALNLMWALFSDDELVNGCCTPSPAGYKILDQTIIGGIRMHINYKFPASSLDDEKIRWKSILQGNMNAKCRSLRSRSPKFVKVQPTVFDATHDDGGCHAGLRDAAHDDGGCRTGLRDAAHDDGGCHAVLTDESEDTAVVFSDDTSGNKSKIWNKFDSYCIRLAGLSAPVMEMAVPLVHELQSLEEGILMFDALFNTNVIVIAPVISFLCDNPRAAEICNHRGSSTHKFCRICMADVRSDHICVGVKRKKHDSLMQVQRKKAAKTHQAKSTIRTEYEKMEYYKTVCQNFVTAIETHLPEWKTKLKVHLVLHLPDDMLMYGPTAAFNTERHAPSKDIANNFAVQESIQFTFSGSYYNPSESSTASWIGQRQVTSGSAIVGSDGFLINICDFIQHKSQANITEIGLLVACFQVDMATFCVVRHMEPVLTPEGAPVLNEFECPLMTHTNILRFIPSEDVKTSVSLVHQYDLRCKAMNTITATTVERHKISVTKTVFHHNWNNDMKAVKTNFDSWKEILITLSMMCYGFLLEIIQHSNLNVEHRSSTFLALQDKIIRGYSNTTVQGVLGKVPGALKPLYIPDLPVNDIRKEAVARGIAVTGKNRATLQKELQEILQGVQRVPSLLLLQPDESLTNLNLQYYKVMDWRRLRASVLPWSDVFRYSIEYWYWLSIKAHRASLLAARAGVGPNRAVSGLWSVTRMNVRPYKNWWNLLRAKIMASASFLTSQQSPPKDVNALTWDEIVEYTKGQFDPTRYVVSERFKYWSSMSRMPGESIQELAARIRHDAVKCNFPAIRDPLDEAMRTRFMCSVSNEAVLKALFKYKEEELTFAKTIAVAMETEEAAKVAKETVYGTKTSPVHKVDYMRRSRSPDSGENPTSYARDKRRDFPLGTCPRCGKSDHRSQIVLSGMPLVERYEVANGQPLPTLGIFSTIVTLLGEDSSDGKAVEFTVTKVRRLNLLGRDAIAVRYLHYPTNFSDLKPDLALQKACEQLCREFPDLFKLELVCLKDFQLEVKFKPDAKPIFCKLRVVPFAIQKDLCQAYDAGIARGVWLTTQFNDYGTPVVPIRKAQLHKN